MPRPSKKKTTVAPRRRYSRTSTVRRSVRGYGGYWDNVKNVGVREVELINLDLLMPERH